ncbi:myb-like DNA-binding domain containing protein [Babesia ovis]|uniref:Myb-like DNA-binding domain containing protein n=1 Tax=Babesia ovis TaxID=5869 RepID=A0A9W5TEL3_BABOV|nr:myb-like DNA-binding domain containing protein [Babesia ovis]
MKDSISQLEDERGRKPASNNDAVLLHNFSASLPVFRRKYDWKVPKWEPEQIKELHNLVKNEIIKDLGSGSSGFEAHLGADELRKAVELLKQMEARLLYELYVSFGPQHISGVIINVVNRSDFLETMDLIHSDPETFRGLFVFGTPQEVPKEGNEDLQENATPDHCVEMSSLWARVANEINNTISGNRSKLATECCSIFLNSKPDGELVEKVTAGEIQRLHHYTSTEPQGDDYLKRGVEIAEELGITLYQLLKAASIPKKATKNRWCPSDDEKLRQIVRRELNSKSRGSKRSQSISWRNVARQMGNKTNEQCRLRWRVIGKGNGSDDTFSEAELYMLQILYAAYGDNWQKISKHLPGKQPHQCRNKFLSSISRPDRNEYLTYFKDLKNTITNRNASVNVRKWWAKVDWLGIKLLKIANITKNKAIMDALSTFYESDEIANRINRLFGDEPLKRSQDLNGIDVLKMSEYLRRYPSQMVSKIVNSAVPALLRKSRTSNASEFKDIFDLGTVDDAQFVQSLNRLLQCAWP